MEQFAHRRQTDLGACERADPLQWAAMPLTVGPAVVPFQIASVASYGDELVVLRLGRVNEMQQKPALCRIHSGCMTGDIFGSLRCDCGAQLKHAIAAIAAEGAGLIVYVPSHEGRGIGLEAKLSAYRLQEEGLDTLSANAALGLPIDARRYQSCAALFKALSVTSIRLLTNNPDKIAALTRCGLEVERARMPDFPNPHNQRYLATKKDKCGHLG